MNEARKFIRYIFPGTIFLGLLICYLSLSPGEKFYDFVSRYVKGTNEGGGIFQTGVFVLLVSGAGYFFATIYHALSKIRSWRLPDHSDFLKDARRKKWLIVYNRKIDGDVPLKGDFSPSEAWSILGAYYHKRIDDKDFKAAHVRIESLNDTLHGLGASWVGSIFAIVVWIFLHYKLSDDFPSYWIFLISIVVWAVLFTNQRRTGREVQNFIDGITSEFMAKESKNGETPIPIHFPSQRELKPFIDTISPGKSHS